MQRNLDNRVEVLVPIKDEPRWPAEMVDVVERCLADDTLRLGPATPTGAWQRRQRADAQRARRARRAGAHARRARRRLSAAPVRPARPPAMSGVRRTAVIDLGSNSFRLVVFRYEPGGAWSVWDEIREPVRLSAGMGADQVLQPEPVARALDTVRTFVAFCRQTGIEDVLAAGTSALRRAANGAEVVAEMEAAGLPVRILDEREEAYYGALAILNSTCVGDGLGLDMGGGSVQLMQLRGRALGESTSLPLGAVRATEDFLAGEDQKAGIKALRREVRKRVAELDWFTADAGPLAGIGGSVRNLAAAAQRLHELPNGGVQGFSLTAEMLARRRRGARRPQRRRAPRARRHQPRSRRRHPRRRRRARDDARGGRVRGARDHRGRPARGPVLRALLRRPRAAGPRGRRPRLGAQPGAAPRARPGPRRADRPPRAAALRGPGERRRHRGLRRRPPAARGRRAAARHRALDRASTTATSTRAT